MGRVLQIVGYQNSGKTSFVVEYIKRAVNHGLKVGTIKHHGHSNQIKLGDQQKDTGKHRQAGACVSTVEGNNSFVITSELMSLSLKQLLMLYNQFQLDFIIVEGFKEDVYPKVVLIRSQEDIRMLDNLLNISCIITNVDLPKAITKKYKIFQQTHESIDWLLTNKVGENIE